MYRFLKPAYIRNYNRTRTLLRLFCNRRSFYHVKDRDPASSDALLKRNFTTNETPFVKQYCSCSILGNSIQNGNLRAPISSQIDDLHPDTKIDELLQNIDDNSANNCKQTKKKFQILNDMVNKKLTSYVEFCVECDFLHFAFNAIDRHVKKYRYNRVTRLTTFKPFVKLMSGFAAKGDLQKVIELMKMMDTCEIEPTPNVYACYLECFGRNEIVPSDDQLEILTKGCQFLGLTLTELESQMTCSSPDSREFTLKAIRSVYPDFIPFDEPPILRYSNSLVRELNEKPKLFRPPCEGLFSSEKLDELADEQIYDELEFVRVIKPTGKPAKNDEWDALLHQWRNTVKEVFVKNLEQEEKILEERLLSYEPNIIPYLRYLNVDQYVDIVFAELCLLLQDYEMRQKGMAVLYVKLGETILHRCRIESKRRKWTVSTMSSFYKNYCHWLIGSKPDENSWNFRHRWQRLVYENANIDPFMDEEDVSLLVHKIGCFFYKIILENLVVRIDKRKNDDDNSRPLYDKAFFSKIVGRNQKIKTLDAHPKLIDLMPDDFFAHNSHLPMISPPVPKVSPESGGSVLHGEANIKSWRHLFSTLRSVPNEQLYPIFDAVNAISSVPWQINVPILEVMQSIFDEGGSAKFDIPSPLSKFDLNDDYVTMLCQNKKLTEKDLECRIRMHIGRAHRLWSEMSRSLSIAHEYGDRIFWLPHVLDNRGRISCVLPYLNHFKGDTHRALIKFAKGVKLGCEGFKWLKIHCVNLNGIENYTMTKQKLEYFDEILPQILDSAEKPLTGDLWWTTGSNKWQTLACCMEIKAVLESNDPENFVSHFPVHRDGSCNVLQHFAALAKDPVAGEYTNITPSSRPQDVYSNVIGLMEYRRRQMVEQGDERAQSLKGCYNRKLIKPLMISYLNGTSKEELVQLARRKLRNMEAASSECATSYATFVIEQMIEQIGGKLVNSRQVMMWLVDCAKVITNDYKNLVEWQTPLGFPIKQPYTKSLTRIDEEKQIKAFPPNFIQSLEATHMMLTSLYCERAGITFTSIFDCFWTHAGTVDVMDKICREQFLAMHSQPILENVSTFFMNRYATNSTLSDNEKSDLSEDSPAHIFNSVPKKGTLDLNGVLQSEYFFS